MKNGICPKCNGNEVYQALNMHIGDKGTIKFGDSRSMIMIHTKKKGFFGDHFEHSYLEFFCAGNVVFLKRMSLTQRKS